MGFWWKGGEEVREGFEMKWLLLSVVARDNLTQASSKPLPWRSKARPGDGGQELKAGFSFSIVSRRST